jgi:DNA-binding FadR family transcriptional regulator
MGQVWDLALPAFEKLVLLALADCANDEGLCWPSIATLKTKSGASERTVQRAIKHLEDMGVLTRRQVPGKGCKYRIDPRHIDTPVRETPVSERREPPSERHPTPVTVTPKPSKNHQEPSTSSSTSDDDDKLAPDHVFEFWNEIAPSMGKACVRDRTPERRKLVTARIAQHNLGEFREAFDNFKRSDFLHSARGCHFDWFMQKKNFQKVLEGNYNG